MKATKVVILILAIAVLLYILVPSLSWAEDQDRGLEPIETTSFTLGILNGGRLSGRQVQLLQERGESWVVVQALQKGVHL